MVYWGRVGKPSLLGLAGPRLCPNNPGNSNSCLSEGLSRTKLQSKDICVYAEESWKRQAGGTSLSKDKVSSARQSP